MSEMKVYNDCRELLEDELKKMVKKGDLTPPELESMWKAMCIVEKIMEVQYKWDDEGSPDGGYSGMRMPRVDMSYGMDSMNASNRRGRSPMTGRYVSRDSERGRDRYNEGRSGHSIEDRIVDKLERMMNEETGDYEKEVIRNFIRQARMMEMEM